ncbi:hypothetical protein MBLNU13_g04190t1 [Cladosporium sp. NU13]
MFTIHFTRASTMIKSLSVAFSCGGTDCVALPLQTQSAPSGPLFPSSSTGYTPISDSSSSFYDANEDFDMTGDEASDVDWESDSECSLLLRSSRRAHVTWQQARRIRQMHFSSLNNMKANLQHTIPLVLYRGASPIFSPVATLPQTPTGFGADDPDLDAIYSGYRHITTLLDLDKVYRLADLLSPTQPDGEDNSDTSAQPGFGVEFAEPAPPMSDVWIDPYGVPAGSWAEHLVCYNVEPASESYTNACHILANSGLNFLTDYDVSTSPRKCVFEISAILRRHDWWTHQSEETIPVDYVLPWPQRLAKVRTTEPLFSRFSYTSQCQPRTECARDTEGEPRSPRSMSPGFGVLFEASE